MPQMKERLTRVSKQLMRRGLSSLPDRYHWEVAARLPISNLGLPVTPEGDLVESGRQETDRIVEQLHDYNESFAIETSTVLDIGCGAGRLLIPMGSKGANAYGIDASRSFLKQCKKNATEHGVDVRLARSEDGIPDFGTEFDLVFCVKTFQSLRRRIMLKYLQDAHQQLADGGILYLTLSDLDSPANKSQLFNEELEDVAPFRNRYFTQDEIRHYLDYIGYTEIQMHSRGNDELVEDQFVVMAKK